MIGIVGGHGFNVQAQQVCRHPIGQYSRQSLERRRHLVANDLRGNNTATDICEKVEGSLVEVIAVLVADQDQVCFGQAGVKRGWTVRIVVNNESVPGHQKAGVRDRTNQDISIGGDKPVTDDICRAGQLVRAIKIAGTSKALRCRGAD
jgi:hypothetical protein